MAQWKYFFKGKLKTYLEKVNPLSSVWNGTVSSNFAAKMEWYHFILEKMRLVEKEELKCDLAGP